MDCQLSFKEREGWAWGRLGDSPSVTELSCHGAGCGRGAARPPDHLRQPARPPRACSPQSAGACEGEARTRAARRRLEPGGEEEEDDDLLHVSWFNSLHFLEKKVILSVLQGFSVFGCQLLLFRSLKGQQEGGEDVRITGPR